MRNIFKFALYILMLPSLGSFQMLTVFAIVAKLMGWLILPWPIVVGPWIVGIITGHLVVLWVNRGREWAEDVRFYLNSLRGR